METLILNKKIEMLPNSAQEMLSDYIDFLVKKYVLADNLPSKRHFAGCMKGVVSYMSDDFNEPLDDFKDYN